MLEQIDIFSCLDKKTVVELERAALRRKVPKNMVLFSKGDDSDSMFVIIEGKAKAVLYNEDGKEILLSLFGPGDYFGEMGVLDGQPRSAGVVTKTPCKLMVLKKESMDRILFRNAALTARLFAKILLKLREATIRIENLMFMNVCGRIINLLLQQGARNKQGSVVLEKLTHQEIANMVGASREMVSRVMKELQCGGYIRTEKKRIELIKQPPPHYDTRVQ